MPDPVKSRRPVKIKITKRTRPKPDPVIERMPGAAKKRVKPSRGLSMQAGTGLMVVSAKAHQTCYVAVRVPEGGGLVDRTDEVVPGEVFLSFDAKGRLLCVEVLGPGDEE